MSNTPTPMTDKHYELLGANIVRYLKSVMAKEHPLSNVEIGKAITMMIELVEREAMRDSREEHNK